MLSHDTLSVSFHTRSNRNVHNNNNVYACLKVEGHPPKEVLVFKALNKEDWDTGHGKPKQTKDYLIKLTLHLDQVKAKLYEIYFDLRHYQEEITPENIKDVYLGKKDYHYSLLKLIETAIEKYKKEVSPGTIKNYGATNDYVKAFCKLKYKRGDVPLKYLTISFIDELKTYILTHPLKHNDICTNNGCMKHMERLKKIMNWAFEMKFIDRNVFASFKVKKKAFESKILHSEQLKILEEKQFNRPILELVKDLFIFSCYTGLAPVDLQQLKPHQIHTDPDGVTWLNYVRVKSKVPADIPLLKVPLLILKKYKLQYKSQLSTTVFPFICNQVLNDNLKIISETLELGIDLNFYIARYTFATTVLLANGVPVTSIKAMMGHKRFESTLHYTKPDKSFLAIDMARLQQKIEAKQKTTAN